ncbi:MAG: flagellar protein FlaG [Acidobacteriota bacterium]
MSEPVKLDIERFSTVDARRVVGLSAPERSRQEDEPKAWPGMPERAKQARKPVEPVQLKELLQVVIDEKTNRLYVQVVDRETGEVLREIPPEELRKLRELVEQLNGRVLDTIA